MATEYQNMKDFTGTHEHKVAAMLGSLNRVDAPGDFDMRVRARIAQGKPSQAGSAWMPVFLRIAAPALLLAVIGGYFGYSALYRQGNVGVPEVVDSTPVSAPVAALETETPTISGPAGETTAVKPLAGSDDLVVTLDKKANAANKKPNRPGGGSLESALRETNSIVPRNVETTVNSTATVPASTLSVREVFGAMGIRASYSGSGWRVSSVSGRAAAAGLKAGDIIESVNGQPVVGNAVFDANFSGRSLRVKRDGASIHITL